MIIQIYDFWGDLSDFLAKTKTLMCMRMSTALQLNSWMEFCVQHWGGVESICLAPSSSALFTGSRDSTIKRWGAAANNGGSLQCESSLEGHCGWVTALAFMPLEPHGLLISGSYDTTIKLWHPRTSVRQPNPS